MGLSIKKGNGGYIGLDKRNYSSNLTSSGNFSIRRHYLTRLSGELGPTIPNTLFEDDFEDGTLDKWTVINGTEPNFWVVGTNAFNGTQSIDPGVYSAYISNDGVNNQYNSDDANVHMFFDFQIPSNATSLTLTFIWSCVGERTTGIGSYDYGYIMLAEPTLFTPNNSEYTTDSTSRNRLELSVDNGKFTGANGGRNTLAATNFQTDEITIDSSYPLWCTNCNRRLIFSWADDGSVSGNPPWAIDNVKLIYNS